MISRILQLQGGCTAGEPVPKLSVRVCISIRNHLFRWHRWYEAN